MTTAALLVGVGIILLALGVLFIRAHYKTLTPNEELEWMGYGEHPFRKQ
ncbi:MAG: hypothetical protein ACMXYD_04650 [Candidatus Woesearchaeota archaeon]